MSLLNKSDLETAAAAVRTHRDKARQIAEKTAEAEKELSSLRAGAGEREMLALDGNYDAGPARSRIRDLEIMLEGLKPAAAKQRERIAQSIGQMQRAKANEIRTAAGKLQEKLDVHLAELRKRLASVEEWEGVRYVPGPPELLQPGEMGITNHGVEILNRVTIGKSQLLREQIAILMQQAATTENQRVALSGSITGGSLKELLNAAAHPDVLAPGEAAITAWFNETEPKAAAERARILGEDMREARVQSSVPGYPHVDLTTAFFVVWDESGVIDRKKSRFDVSGFRRSAAAAEQPAA